MRITREQYEADIRKAKAQALRGAADDFAVQARETGCDESIWDQIFDLRARANELDPE